MPQARCHGLTPPFFVVCYAWSDYPSTRRVDNTLPRPPLMMLGERLPTCCSSCPSSPAVLTGCCGSAQLPQTESLLFEASGVSSYKLVFLLFPDPKHPRYAPDPATAKAFGHLGPQHLDPCCSVRPNSGVRGGLQRHEGAHS